MEDIRNLRKPNDDSILFQWKHIFCLSNDTLVFVAGIGVKKKGKQVVSRMAENLSFWKVHFVVDVFFLLLSSWWKFWKIIDMFLDVCLIVGWKVWSNSHQNWWFIISGSKKYSKFRFIYEFPNSFIKISTGHPFRYFHSLFIQTH